MSNVRRPPSRYRQWSDWWVPPDIDRRPTPAQADAARRLCEQHAHGDDDLTDLLQVLRLDGRTDE